MPRLKRENVTASRSVSISPCYAVSDMSTERRSNLYQPPKGTRDFYPADLAVRRHLESIWRGAAISHGFEEIDGPTFEHLELYTAKSGPGIVSELFSFRRAGGETEYALRPEFTPTLARMAAARAAQLPRPIKWFSMPSFFRAERPQRGRLREFQQWNVDVIGDDSPRAEAEVIATCIGALETMGLTPDDVTIRISHRELIAASLRAAGVAGDQVEPAMILLDKQAKLDAKIFADECNALGLKFDAYQAAASEAAGIINDAIAAVEAGGAINAAAASESAVAAILALVEELAVIDALRWCEFDFSIVRGLAYYTGMVFEVHETSGRERAIAGGGRYDKLIELFGGPPTPAVGFAMGDVVIRLVLEERGLLQPAETYLPRPDVFVISANESFDRAMRGLVAALRREKFHARHPYKATRNIGKLLGEAGKVRARCAVILGEEFRDGRIILKNLDAGQQDEIAIDPLDYTLAAKKIIEQVSRFPSENPSRSGGTGVPPVHQ